MANNFLGAPKFPIPTCPLLDTPYIVDRQIQYIWICSHKECDRQVQWLATF